MSDFSELRDYGKASTNITLLDCASQMLQQCSGHHLDDAIAKLCTEIQSLQNKELKRKDFQGRTIIEGYSY